MNYEYLLNLLVAHVIEFLGLFTVLLILLDNSFSATCSHI